MSTDRYPFREIEAKWQGIWEATKQFRVHEDPSRPKFYCLQMFPYPSGRIHLRPGLLQMGAAHLHQDARAGPRLPKALDGELVPVLPDGARERAGGGRPVLAVRLRGDAARDRRLVLQDHELRGGAPRLV